VRLAQRGGSWLAAASRAAIRAGAWMPGVVGRAARRTPVRAVIVRCRAALRLSQIGIHQRGVPFLRLSRQPGYEQPGCRGHRWPVRIRRDFLSQQYRGRQRPHSPETGSLRRADLSARAHLRALQASLHRAHSEMLRKTAKVSRSWPRTQCRRAWLGTLLRVLACAWRRSWPPNSRDRC
jgi:hypothetical protein